MYKNSVCWFLWAAHQVDYPPSPTSELQGQILYRAQHALVVLLPEAIWFKPGNNSRGKEWAGDPSDVQLKPTSARSRPNKRLSPGNTVRSYADYSEHAYQMGGTHVVLYRAAIRLHGTSSSALEWSLFPSLRLQMTVSCTTTMRERPVFAACWYVAQHARIIIRMRFEIHLCLLYLCACAFTYLCDELVGRLVFFKQARVSGVKKILLTLGRWKCSAQFPCQSSFSTVRKKTIVSMLNYALCLLNVTCNHSVRPCLQHRGSFIA